MLLASAALLATGKAGAEEIGEQDAMIKARQFRNTLSKTHKAASQDAMYLAYKAPARTGNAFYVFNSERGRGYTIVSGNDVLPEILGYSDSGYFDAGNIPDNMRVWLKGYVDQANYAIENNLSPAKSDADIRQEVAPMISSAWNQDAPYNNLCPIDKGKRSYTGCVATAMAQVMNYYEWPARAQGTCSFNGSTVTLSSEYEWDRMLDKYSRGEYNDAEANAVAQLMYDCGRAVNMQYSSNGSGAQAQMIQLAMCSNFSYDKGLLYYERKYFGAAEWDDMMYAEMAAGRPVIYAGLDEDGGGHEFILDGYRAGGFYHLNWGWSGVSDGYFRLDALNPSSQGAGGGTGSEGFNYEQDANFMIRKPAGGIQQVNVFGTGKLNVANVNPSADSFFITDSKLYGTNSDGTPVQINRFMNFTGQVFTAQLGVKLTNVDSGEEFFIYNASEVTFKPWSTGVSAMPIDFSDIPEGRYTLYPYSREVGNDENVQRMRCPAAQNNYFVVDITSEGRTYYEPKDAPGRMTASLSLNPAEAMISINEGIRLNPEIMPVYASQDLEWSSSAPEVASVSNGLVFGVKQGTAIITAKTTDGSNLSATCEITVTEQSGVEEIETVSDTVTVYDIMGRLIFADKDKEMLDTLESGIYIVNGKKMLLKK